MPRPPLLARLARPHRARMTAGLPPGPDGPAAHAIYQVTPKVLGRRRATRAKPVRPAGRRLDCESARRQPENKPHGPDITARPASETMTVTLDFARMMALPGSAAPARRPPASCAPCS